MHIVMEARYRRVAIGLFVSVLALGGCGTGRDRQVDPNIGRYVIAVDGDGRPVNPRLTDSTPNAGEADKKSGGDLSWEFERQVKDMLLAMDEWHARPEVKAKGPRRILIFVHGGLNQPRGSVDAAENDLRDMTSAESLNAVANKGYYPIFVNWDSGLTSSYGEHLLHVRRGRKGRKSLYAGVLAAPLVFLADVGRAITRAPLVWVYQIERDVQLASSMQLLLSRQDGGKPWLSHPRLREAEELYAELRRRYEHDPENEIRISLGEARGSRPQTRVRTATYLLTSPTKFLSSPFIDGGGTPAWDNMSRRTLMMFEGAALDGDRSLEDAGTRDVGAVQRLADELTRHLEDHGADGSPYELTLIGHSMGAIVLNEFIRRNPRLPYRDIVYMGAACSVRDFDRCVMPMLRDNPRVRFFNLCLHPLAELRETTYLDLVARGSLLVWVDDFFANPATPLDRTLGRWENVLEYAYLIPKDVRRRVSIKAFDLTIQPTLPRDPRKGTTGSPQRHSHFRTVRYWEEDFWTPLPVLRSEAEGTIGERSKSEAMLRRSVKN
jgi:pimeloyl-ACP methyl ester carboxylesterase